MPRPRTALLATTHSQSSTIISSPRVSGDGLASVSTQRSPSPSRLTREPRPARKAPALPPTPKRQSHNTDTGAQSDLWSLTEFLACGYSRDNLFPIKMNLATANRSPIAIEGAFFAKLTTTTRHGKVASSSVQTMYLSCESLLNLALLPYDFPSHSEESNSDEQRRPGDTDVADSSPHHLSVNATQSLNNGCTTPKPDDATCSCPQRAVTPPRPPALPFHAYRTTSLQ